MNMLKYSILIVMVIALSQNIFAQDKALENQTAIIAKRIDSLILSEKTIMKKSLKAVDKQLEKNELSEEEATIEKRKIAEYHAKKINEGVALQEQKLQSIIMDRVNGTLKSSDEKSRQNTPFFTDLSSENYEKDSITGIKIEKRFTSQLVIALGANTIIGNDDGFYGDGFKTSPFGFGEAGFAFKYRLKEQSNLWNLKFGFSVAVYELIPNNDNDIAITSENQTTLQDAGYPIKRAKLNMGYLTLPLHLELDFSKQQFDKDSKQYYLRSQRGVRMGVGGFFGVRYFTNQLIRFEENGKKIRRTERDDFNMNTFTFGPSAYIGYRDTSIFVRYDANPIFKDNPSDINNLSFGLRFDFN